MRYSYDLIRLTDLPASCPKMFSLILLEASSLQLDLNGIRCYLDGKYFICLNENDSVKVLSGEFGCTGLMYDPYFINVNLSTEIIGSQIYPSMRDAHNYPDFMLFIERNDRYFGIISLSPEEFNASKLFLGRISDFIENNPNDVMWSCRSRSQLFSLLSIAHNSYFGERSGEGNEIIRFIKDHPDQNLTLASLCRQFSTNRTTLSETIKNLTGMPPMTYVLENRLSESRFDLLFTEIPVAEIALKFGFHDPNYYIRAFKKRYEKPPLQYRLDGRAARPRR